MNYPAIMFQKISRQVLFYICALWMLSGGVGKAEELTLPAGDDGKRVRIIIEDTAQAEKLSALEKKIDKLLGAQGVPVEETAVTVTKTGSGTTTEASASLAALELIKDNASYVWIVLGGILVFNMHSGFTMLELGVCRAKNSINIVMKNYLDFCIGSIVYLFIGFAIQFGDSWNGVFGASNFWLSSFGSDSNVWVFWFFQVGFASVACTIVSGAMAERTKFVGYCIYSAVFMFAIYPVSAHWIWGSAGGSWGMSGDKGWLEALGFVDFAGSTVVHACGGACALAGIIVVGPRVGRFAKDGTPRLIAGHNIPLAALGAFLLWFGWFGFNACSTLAADVSIGRVATNTLISPCAGALIAMISMWFIQGKPDVSIAINGSLGGAVGITACCANISPASAFVVGIGAGLLTTVSTIMLERFRLDDVAGAVPVHLVNGWWGTLSVALFDEKGFNIDRLGVQALGVASVSIFAFAVCFIAFIVIDKLIGLRASDDEQVDGLDFSEHAANAYPDFQTNEQA